LKTQIPNGKVLTYTKFTIGRKRLVFYTFKDFFPFSKENTKGYLVIFWVDTINLSQGFKAEQKSIVFSCKNCLQQFD